MREHQLEVFHSQLDDSEVITCHGWMDSDTCEELQRVLDAAFDHGVQRLRLDLVDVCAIDEAGVECLFKAAQRCREVGASIEFESSPIVRGAINLAQPLA
jgi:anti-anti-sigma regulatory factor